MNLSSLSSLWSLSSLEMSLMSALERDDPSAADEAREALLAGGALRLVVDSVPGEPGMLRMRVRLLRADGRRNCWLLDRTAPARRSSTAA